MQISIRYQKQEDWEYGRNNYQDLAGVTEEQMNVFIDAIYAGEFEYVFETQPDFYNDSAHKQLHLRMQKDDHTVIELRLFDNGYVGYEYLGWYSVKVPTEVIDMIFNACK